MFSLASFIAYLLFRAVIFLSTVILTLHLFYTGFSWRLFSSVALFGLKSYVRLCFILFSGFLIFSNLFFLFYLFSCHVLDFSGYASVWVLMADQKTELSMLATRTYSCLLKRPKPVDPTICQHLSQFLSAYWLTGIRRMSDLLPIQRRSERDQIRLVRLLFSKFIIVDLCFHS